MVLYWFPACDELTKRCNHYSNNKNAIKKKTPPLQRLIGYREMWDLENSHLSISWCEILRSHISWSHDLTLLLDRCFSTVQVIKNVADSRMPLCIIVHIQSACTYPADCTTLCAQCQLIKKAITLVTHYAVITEMNCIIKIVFERYQNNNLTASSH